MGAGSAEVVVESGLSKEVVEFRRECALDDIEPDEEAGRKEDSAISGMR